METDGRKLSPPQRWPPAPGPCTRAIALASAVLLLTAAASCAGRGGAETTAPEPPAPLSAGSPADGGHGRMVALLADLAERSARDNEWLGDGDLPALRDRLARLPSDAPVSSRYLLLSRIGVEELRVGDTDGAIEHLTAAQGLLPRLGPAAGPEHRITIDYNLGVTWMRKGETQNCVARHTSDSCILPIRGKGIHTVQEGSREAIGHFTRVLEDPAGDEATRVASRWLLNIAYMTVGGYPAEVPAGHLIPPDTFASDEEFPRFTDIAPRLGLNTFDLAGGAICDDFDGDHLLDIVVSTMDTSGQMRLFRNNGDGTFAETTHAAGLTGLFGGLNLLHADYDNDGDADVLVPRGAWFGRNGRHPNSLLRNNGDGTFTDVTFEAGLGEVHYPTQTASWADYDNDGDLDLYVGNEAAPGQPYPCQLFRNNGDGTFTDVARQAGVENMRFTKAVVWGDVDDDRWMDLYVSNLRGQNRLYRNNGDGTFTDVAAKLGVQLPLDSFPVWFWDFDNDGALDLYVSSYHQASHVSRLHAVAADWLGLPHVAETPRLYQGDGRGGFREVAARQNVARVSMPMGCNVGDLDNDGYLDFYLGTGWPAYDGLVPNVMYRNRRGAGFADVTLAGGFGHLQKGHGVSFADLDNDGDQDVFEQMGGLFPGDGFGNVLYENPGFGNNWIVVRLVGVRSNRSAIGARIRAEVIDRGERRSIHRRVNSGGTFGANPLRRQIGLGGAERIEVLEVFWPATGSRQVFRGVPANRFIEITEGREEFALLSPKRFRFR